MKEGGGEALQKWGCHGQAGWRRFQRQNPHLKTEGTLRTARSSVTWEGHVKKPPLMAEECRRCDFINGMGMGWEAEHSDKTIGRRDSSGGMHQEPRRLSPAL